MGRHARARYRWYNSVPWPPDWVLMLLAVACWVPFGWVVFS